MYKETSGLVYSLVGNKPRSKKENKCQRKYILYFVSPDGLILDFTQRPTLNETMEVVSSVVGEEEWNDCDIDLGDEWESIPKEIFE